MTVLRAETLGVRQRGWNQGVWLRRSRMALRCTIPTFPRWANLCTYVPAPPSQQKTQENGMQHGLPNVQCALNQVFERQP